MFVPGHVRSYTVCRGKATTGPAPENVSHALVAAGTMKIEDGMWLIAHETCRR